MDEGIRSAVAGDEAYVVGGAVRDELLGRRVVDVDVACREPQAAAREFRRLSGGAVFLLSERHIAWRVALPDGRTFDFTGLRGTIEADLAGRDFTVNAIAMPVGGGDAIDPHRGRADLDAGVLRVVSEHAFADDPLRLLRAVRLENELGLRLDPETEALVRRAAELTGRPAGERILGELVRLGPDGYRRLGELGLLRALGGDAAPLDRLGPRPSPELLLVACLGESVFALPISNELRRRAGRLLAAQVPADASPREIHRFRRATEPWSMEALELLGARRELAEAVERARREQPVEPLVRGDELGVPEGPLRGSLLDRIEEERAAGAIRTRDEALALVRELTSR
jgi:hypothetical protein